MEYFVLHFQIYLLLAMRLGGIFVVSPFYGGGTIPYRVKAILAIITAMIIYPIIVKEYAITIPKSMVEYAILLAEELFIGLAIGALVSIIYGSFQLAGEMISMHIGFSVSNVIDPEAQIEVPIFGYFNTLIGILAFLAIGGHHLIIEAVYTSYKTIPLGALTKQHIGSFFRFSVGTFMEMFVVAIKLSLPIIGVTMVIYTVLGILSRVAPQMNVFMLGFPIQIFIGFITMIILAPIIVTIMMNAFWFYFDKLFYFIKHINL